MTPPPVDDTSAIGPRTLALFERTAAEYPQVHAFGYDTPANRHNNPAPVSTREFALCYGYLSREYVGYRHLRPAQRRNSYGLKHEIEEAVGRYVTNGAAILAALAVGFVVRRIEDTPNAWVFAVRRGETVRVPLAPFPARRGGLSLRLRTDVMERDDFRCRRCGATADDGARLVVDHITPVSRGGRTTLENLQVLCSPCNAGKSDREPHAHDRRGRD